MFEMLKLKWNFGMQFFFFFSFKPFSSFRQKVFLAVRVGEEEGDKDNKVILFVLPIKKFN